MELWSSNLGHFLTLFAQQHYRFTLASGHQSGRWWRALGDLGLRHTEFALPERKRSP